MEPEIIKLTGAITAVNCYLVFDEELRECVLIDSGVRPSRIKREIKLNSLKLRYILNTHTHFDHIAGNKAMKRFAGAEILLHENEARRRPFLGRFVASPTGFVKDGDTVSAKGISFKVLSTPGHTPGGVCYLMDKILFSGDTLFRGSVGRTDFPGGDYDLLMKSIREKIIPLPDDVRVLPGHGDETTIGAEKRANPFLLKLVDI